MLRLNRVIIFVAMVVFALASSAMAAEIVGKFTVVHGDDPEGTKDPKINYFLFSREGHRELKLPEEMMAKARELNGKKVVVTADSAPSPMAAEAVNVIGEKKEPSAAVRDSRWIILLGNFSNGTCPIDLGKVLETFTSEEFPNMKDQYHAFMNQQVNFVENVVAGFADLGNRDDYEFPNDLAVIMQRAVDGLNVDVSGYDGIILVANDVFGGYLWGGGTVVYKDGQQIFLKAAWLAILSSHLVAHEVAGHAENGYAHSCGPDGGDFSQSWCSMGGWPDRNRAFNDYIPIEHNAFYQSEGGYIPPEKIYKSPNGSSGVVELSCLDLPVSAVPGYKLIQIDAGPAPYGVRKSVNLQSMCRNGGYSDEAKSSGVIIFKGYVSVPGRNYCSSQLYDPNLDGNGDWEDVGTPLKPGDPVLNMSQVVPEAGDVSVRVLSQTPDGYMVEVVNNNEPLGSITATIVPVEAITAGAKWRVDGGIWQNSGAVVNGLALGEHNVEFSWIDYWDTPLMQVVNVASGQTTAVTGTYVPSPGSITTTIVPVEAITAGAEWRVDGGVWQGSGAVVNGLAPGEHKVEFREIAHWDTPAMQAVNVASCQTMFVTGTYALSFKADFSASVEMGKAPLKVSFRDESIGSISSWLWDFGDGGKMNKTNSYQNPVHTYKRPGSYTVKLMIVGTDGNVNVRCKTSFINIYTLPKANFIAKPVSGKAPLSVTFSDKSKGSIKSWLWEFGDGQTSSEQNPKHTYSTKGLYAAKLTVTGPLGSSYKRLKIRVK